MPKSKHRPPHRKEKKDRTAQIAASPAASGPTSSTVPQLAKTAPPSGANKTTLPVTSAARHPYVSGELKRIGILTAIVIVLLIIFAVALPRFI